MAIRTILTAPDPRLKKKSKPVDSVDAEVRQLMDDMLETMYDAPGIGLAAPQIGELRRVIVLDIDREDLKTGPILIQPGNMVVATTVFPTSVPRAWSGVGGSGMRSIVRNR